MNNAVPDEDVPEDVEDVDVDVEGSVDNPFADVPADQMPVDEIPIEIRTEEDMEEGGDGMPDEAGNATKPLEDPIFDDGLLDDTVEFEITGEVAKRQEYFQPVTSEDRATIAKYCGITMPVMPTGKIEPVFTGRGRLCRNPGRPRHPVEPDGGCYFHALSFLITGKTSIYFYGSISATMYVTLPTYIDSVDTSQDTTGRVRNGSGEWECGKKRYGLHGSKFSRRHRCCRQT